MQGIAAHCVFVLQLYVCCASHRGGPGTAIQLVATATATTMVELKTVFQWCYGVLFDAFFSFMVLFC